jgi:hypothetical protein
MSYSYSVAIQSYKLQKSFQMLHVAVLLPSALRFRDVLQQWTVGETSDSETGLRGVTAQPS